VDVALWHGVNPVLLLSAATTVMGLVAYVSRPPALRAGERLAPLSRLGPAAAYDAGLRGLMRVARAQTRALQTGRLSDYVRLTVATFTAAAAYVLVSRDVLGVPVLRIPAWHEAVLLILMAGGAVSAVRVRSRVTAVVALGIVGVGVALTFLVWSGPDLALTQFAVDTLSVLLFVFIVHRLPPLTLLSSGAARARDAAVAGAAALVITLLVWASMTAPHEAPLQRDYAEASVPEAHGRNVVNVILVDFRAFDTLGEITVLVVAALGVHALIRLRLQERD
jgi:multicomponent Na+:H+ antiporter subunit A